MNAMFGHSPASTVTRTVGERMPHASRAQATSGFVPGVSVTRSVALLSSPTITVYGVGAFGSVSSTLASVYTRSVSPGSRTSTRTTTSYWKPDIVSSASTPRVAPSSGSTIVRREMESQSQPATTSVERTKVLRIRRSAIT